MNGKFNVSMMKQLLSKILFSILYCLKYTLLYVSEIQLTTEQTGKG